VPSDPATDRADLVSLQKGEVRALDRLVERWQRPLAGFAYRYVQNSADAQDLVADTFVRLYQNRMRLRPDSNVGAWLFTTLSNLCRNQHRWRRRHPSVPFGPSESHGLRQDGGSEAGIDPPAPEASPDAALVRDEALDALRSAIDALSHDLKTAVLLHHYERLSYGEIASVVGCSERGVETRLYRARQQLRDGLKAHIGEAAAR
jgi:RNA polymerase sigma-70 factor (ECF subfamily)